ncbi:MAG: hypothetical protein J07HX5_00010 [halophilic archaeon J07HX5]|nr:MAG: hypothetical protein J07HX5_00010 [halophilic archaeon J07HX5]
MTTSYDEIAVDIHPRIGGVSRFIPISSSQYRSDLAFAGSLFSRVEYSAIAVE